jgi:K+-sensing histidine kinase KdpD
LKKGEANARATGTGFGLFFASVMIDSYNGDIWVEESDRGGSEFVIEILEACV